MVAGYIAKSASIMPLIFAGKHMFLVDGSAQPDGSPRRSDLSSQSCHCDPGHDKDDTRELCDLLNAVASFDPPCFSNVNMQENAVDHTVWVERALLEIAEDQYSKVIVS